MRRNLPQNVTTEKTRHGKRVYYFRVGKGPRIRLPDIQSEHFNEALEAAHKGRPTSFKHPGRARPGTLKFVTQRYLADPSFRSLAPVTRKNRRAQLERICAKSGDVTITSITRQHIVAGRNRRALQSGHVANAYLKAMRPLFAYALEAGYIQNNPCDGIRAARIARGGYHTWTIEEIERFEARHPVGSMGNLALRLMLYTGARRADACKLGVQNLKAGVLTFTPAKTRNKTGVMVSIPVLPPVQEALAATNTGEMVFLTTGFGLPFASAASFGNWFADRCIEAGVPGRAHGLRKAGATLAAENGATASQLMAMFGWTNIAQAELYTRAADRAGMAGQAANLLLRKGK